MRVRSLSSPERSGEIMNFTEQERLIAEISAKHPIPADRVYPGDSEAQEQARVRKWVTKSMTGSNAPAATAGGVEATCDLVVKIVSPIVADLQRQIAELTARAKLSEDRCLGLEQRAVRLEERVATLETRALGPLPSSLSSHAGTAH
jgi:hypothetical protein